MRQPQSYSPSSENAFDFLRVLAATAVLFSHSFALYGMPEPEPVAGTTLGTLAVAAFFAISGYLVSLSWKRDPAVLRFAARRGLRIFPGLLVVVLLTALVAGPLLSSLGWRGYFDTGAAWEYIRVAGLGLGSPSLAGVFEHNPYPNAVNGSLWTIRYELLMYATLALVGLIVGVPRLAFAFVLIAISAGTYWVYIQVSGVAPSTISVFNGIPFFWRFSTDFQADRIAYLAVFFFIGAFLQVADRQIPLSKLLAFALFVPALILENKVLVMIALWIAVPYGVLTIAFTAHRFFHRFNGLDCSYGVYIYAFPVQQAVSSLGSHYGLDWSIVLLTSLLVTFLLAALSWHYIERPALRLKNFRTERKVSVPAI